MAAGQTLVGELLWERDPAYPYAEIGGAMPAGDDHQSRRVFDSANLDTKKLGGGTGGGGPGVGDAGRGRTLYLLRPDATREEIEDVVRRIRGLDEGDPR